MRVLHLTTHIHIGGITTYILKLVRPFRERGIETFILSSGGQCTGMFQKRGATTFELPIRTKSEASLKLWFALPKVLKIIRDNKIDILHAHTRVTQVLAEVIHRITGIPVVTTCHGFYKVRLGRRLLPSWGNRVIAISDSVSQHLLDDFHLSAGKIVTINNAVDLDEIDQAYALHDPKKVRIDYGFQPDDPVVGIVARLVEDKGHEYLIRAAHHLRGKYPNLRILIVGDGRYRNDLERLVAELGVTNQIHFLGNVTDVTKPLAAMDIFVLPATWREGFGLSIVEAMACYKPVIVSNIWSLNRLIEDHVTGFLVEPRQVEPLAKVISFLLDHPDQREAMGVRVRKTVEELFPIDRMAQAIQRVYQSVFK